MALASSPPEDNSEKLLKVELVIPMTEVKELTNLLYQADYLFSCQKPMSDIMEIYKQFYQKALPWTSGDVGRSILLGAIKGKPLGGSSLKLKS